MYSSPLCLFGGQNRTRRPALINWVINSRPALPALLFMTNLQCLCTFCDVYDVMTAFASYAAFQLFLLANYLCKTGYVLLLINQIDSTMANRGASRVITRGATGVGWWLDHATFSDITGAAQGVVGDLGFPINGDLIAVKDVCTIYFTGIKLGLRAATTHGR